MNAVTAKPTARREFLRATAWGAVVAGGLSLTGRALGQSKAEDPSDASPPQPYSAEKIRQFVNDAHFNVDVIKSMLKEEPKLANACIDWGGGDFESALGASSHMGRRDIASVLLDHGARKDIFYAAMSGDTEVVTAFVSSDPSIVSVPGPHGLTLMYHAVLSKDLNLVTYLQSNGAAIGHYDLQAAAMADSYEMAEWLLENGVVYDGEPVFMGKNWAEFARENGRERIARLLESRKVSD